MKKISLFGLGIILMAAFSSCEKSYTCTCVYPGAAVGTTSTTYKAKKKSEAEATCAAQNTAAKATGGSCAL